MPTVRDAVYEVLRRHGLTTLFANPGSTEIAFLAGLPDDFRFVLALHEASVVGMATGFALARDRPALVNLHTTAGLGNAVGALATARVNRSPLVVIVGQQDRRHLLLEPFLTGRLRGLAGEYPVWHCEPARPQDVPSAVARAVHEASTARGPALVVVPSGDWAEELPAGAEVAAPALVHRPAGARHAVPPALAAMLRDAAAPALVTGAGASDPECWRALVALAERLGAPVWQESFGARAGFPQDHPLFAGHLPASRGRLRAALGAYDVVVVVGAPVFRQYPYETGPLIPPGTRAALITDDPDEAHRGPVEIAVLAKPAAVVRELTALLPARPSTGGVRPVPPAVPAPAPGAPLRPPWVLAELGRRLPADVVLVEETPSSRPDLHALIPARTPLGFVSAAMGGLGFGLPAALGLRLGDPGRPVVAVLGDGSSMYSIQALWSAAHYRIGALLIVLANGRYAIMDRLAERAGGKPAWPAFTELNISGMAASMGCPHARAATAAELTAALDEVIPGLRERREPLLLEVVVEPDPEFDPITQQATSRKPSRESDSPP
ncbi:thiamine pyrophosphate-dependent enzyme [Amorphoplanes digitatis]|uniref:Benzoylformate decarboxylase n=1 Tax=Actinoplanes digitatis TaxID=1868 RepID=A0A7W7MRI7_9ACTN|nr:thiamine pyrophosphate-dependent enzyme [Actinoplanes digitatis]MBB4763792.1 benzoylformate decarboxylase [Actinoplanes digitatis]GID95728.1 benzoylformate decarboxylase [Actinoplanes digitatis]